MDKLKMLFHLNNAIFDYSNKIIRILRLPTELKAIGVRKRNKELLKYKKNERCFVIGLGPSLKNVDFSKLDGDIIATNRFHRFDHERKYIPNYYCLMDGAYFDGDAEQDFIDMCNAYPYTCFVVNGRHKLRIEKNKKIPLTQLNMYFAYMWNGSFTHKKKLDFTGILPVANNVVNIAIFLALYCDYKEIVLLGCDFNSFASPVANHCYAESSKQRLWTLDYELYCYSLVAKSHAELRKYADAHKIKILNATKGSLMDAYPFDNEWIRKLYLEEKNYEL